MSMIKIPIITMITTTVGFPPRLPPHLEILAGEANPNLTLSPRVLHFNLEIVGEPPHRGRPVGLHDADVVAVEAHVRVLHGQLVGRHHEEAAGAVDGVELRRGLLSLVRRAGGPGRAEPCQRQEVRAEIAAIGGATAGAVAVDAGARAVAVADAIVVAAAAVVHRCRAERGRRPDSVEGTKHLAAEAGDGGGGSFWRLRGENPSGYVLALV